MYYRYLSGRLSFPFDATYSYNTGMFRSKTRSIEVLSLLDPEEFPGEDYGIFCQARDRRKKIEIPRIEVELGRSDSNWRLVSDFSYWFVNW